MLRNSGEHGWANLVAVMEGKHEIAEPRLGENPCEPFDLFSTQPIRSNAAITRLALVDAQFSEAIDPSLTHDIGGRQLFLKTVRVCLDSIQRREPFKSLSSFES
jgi:hypothetical protein